MREACSALITSGAWKTKRKKQARSLALVSCRSCEGLACSSGTRPNRARARAVLTIRSRGLRCPRGYSPSEATRYPVWRIFFKYASSSPANH
jgi:hypothetical protein